MPTDLPLDWPLDGFAEVDFGSVVDMAKSAMRMRSVLLDEQNVFDLVVSHVHTKSGGRKWSEPVTQVRDELASFALLIRRRKGVSNRPFAAFVHDQLGNALVHSGASDVRTRTFIPRVLDTYVSPGVQHREPPNRRIDAVATYAIPASDAHLLHGTPAMRHAISTQGRYCTAMYVHETSLVPVLP